ncbi:flagellar biosynthetic protein FliO [Xylophilus sp. ASV27]|uniref:flagellar biosynthetic protein FliO n=1 Tax=Xylophilus sp. ASV27 TaxID=2795129 RepID=UPI0018EB92E0
MTLPLSIPLRRESEHGGLDWMSGETNGFILVVLLLVGGIWLAWLAWRRRRFSAATLGRLFKASDRPRLQVVHSARLTPKHSVHEVQWQGRSFLLACAEQDISLIAEAQVTVASSTAEPT